MATKTEKKQRVKSETKNRTAETPNEEKKSRAGFFGCLKGQLLIEDKGDVFNLGLWKIIAGCLIPHILVWAMDASYRVNRHIYDDISQAIFERLTLVSSDMKFPYYRDKDFDLLQN